MNAQDLSYPTVSARAAREESWFDTLLFLLLFGAVPVAVVWSLGLGYVMDRRSAAALANTNDGHFHASPFRPPQGCAQIDYRPGDPIARPCHTSANFLGFGWLWTPPGTLVDGRLESPRGRSGNDGYYRMRNDVLNVRCQQDACYVSGIWRGSFV